MLYIDTGLAFYLSLLSLGAATPDWIEFWHYVIN